MSPLTTDERLLFHELITASTLMSRMAHIAGTTISEEFEAMVSDPLRGLDEVLSQCPPVPGSSWDGTFDEDSVDEENFTPDVPEEVRTGRVNSGVRLRHRHTGLAVEVYASADVNENRRRAMRALKQRVEKAGRDFRDDPRRDPLAGP